MLPKWFSNYQKKKYIKQNNASCIDSRVAYYNKLSKTFTLPNNTPPVSALSKKNSNSVYFFDAAGYARFLPSSSKINWLFGDVTHIPDCPSIVKSRPINDTNANSVILKLNKVRHFKFIKDRIAYEKKKSMLVARGKVDHTKTIRVRFLEQFFDHPMCNAGNTYVGKYDHWLVKHMAISEQLTYKFILCWEGVDVASNLKWVMSSNSIAIMTKPKYETWFMEGQLIPNHHYIEIKDDFSDLEEKLHYYSEHIDAAKEIIKNANAYTQQFRNRKQENLIAIKVLEKYLTLSGQSIDSLNA